MKDELNEIPIDWEELFGTIEGLHSGVDNRIIIEREVVPIIFVPGIMGSRLKVAKGDSANKKAWDPDATFFMVGAYGLLRSKAAKRKALLVGQQFKKDYLAVITHQDIDVVKSERKKQQKKFKNYPGAAERGWCEVSWSSYGELLKKLQDHPWCEPNRHCFEFPVHACGYNWAASNRDSGEALAQRINEVIASYLCQGRRCEHVILVTHSMGGLVARAASELSGAQNKVLGVVHGVQPSTGSPAGYWRMKGGFERPLSAPPDEKWRWLRNPGKMLGHKTLGVAAARVLGLDGEEVTALLGNMPGGLQLLPNQYYRTNKGKKGWLMYPDATGKKVIAKPKRNPYKEIYREKSAFYRLVVPEWLAPGEEKVNTESFEKSPWEWYEEYLTEAESFHRDLKQKVHPETVQFYSEGLATFDEAVYSRHVQTWTTKVKRLLGTLKDDLPGKAVGAVVQAPIKSLIGFKAFSPTGFIVSSLTMTALKDRDSAANQGGFRTYADEDDQEIREETGKAAWVLQLQLPAYNPSQPENALGSGGDGTVPTSSGAALRKKVNQTVRFGKEHASWLFRGHEPIYKIGPAQYLTFAAIENLGLKKIEDKVGPP